MKTRILLAASLSCAVAIATATEIKDSFDITDTDWVSAKGSFADKYTVLVGKLQLLDKKVVSPMTEIGQRNEVLLEDPLIPDTENQPFTISVDFQMSDVEASGAVVLLMHYTNQQLAYFRLRTASGNRSFAQLMISKNGQQAKPVSEDLSVVFAPGHWYRLTIKAQAGEYQYEISDAEAGGNVLASGTLLDRMHEGGPHIGGQVGFGASGAPFTLDNFEFKVGS